MSDDMTTQCGELQVRFRICQIVAQGLLVYLLVAHFVKYMVVERDSATECGAQFIVIPPTVTIAQ